MMTLPQDRFSRSSRGLWPGGTALLLSTAVHAAILPVAGLLWTCQPATPPQADSLDVVLAWEAPPVVDDVPSTAQPPAAPRAIAPPPVLTPVLAPVPAPAPAARRLTHAASHVLDATLPMEPVTDVGASPAIAEAVAAPAPPPQVAALPPPPKAELLARYSRLLLGQLERFKTYPVLSQRRGEEGTVLLRLTLAEDGRLLSAEPVGQGAERLVLASLAAVQAASPFPPLPEELNSHQLVFDLPITYQLR